MEYPCVVILKTIPIFVERISVALNKKVVINLVGL